MIVITLLALNILGIGAHYKPENYEQTLDWDPKKSGIKGIEKEKGYLFSGTAKVSGDDTYKLLFKERDAEEWDEIDLEVGASDSKSLTCEFQKENLWNYMIVIIGTTKKQRTTILSLLNFLAPNDLMKWQTKYLKWKSFGVNWKLTHLKGTFQTTYPAQSNTKIGIASKRENGKFYMVPKDEYSEKEKHDIIEVSWAVPFKKWWKTEWMIAGAWIKKDAKGKERLVWIRSEPWVVKKTIIWVSVLIFVGILSIIICCCCFCRYYRRRKGGKKGKHGHGISKSKGNGHDREADEYAAREKSGFLDPGLETMRQERI